MTEVLCGKDEAEHFIMVIPAILSENDRDI